MYREVFMSILYGLHGSAASPEHPNNFEFKIFDHVYNTRDEVSDHEYVNSGLDAEGPGVYVFGSLEPSFTKEQINGASHYAGKGQGSLFGLNITLERDDDGDVLDFANNLEPDLVSVDEWANVIQQMIEKTREAYGFDGDRVIELVDEASMKYSNGGKPTKEEILEIKECMGGIPESEISWRDDYDLNSWSKNIKGQLDSWDPAEFILNEGEPYDIAEDVIENSDNLWETLKLIWQRSACDYRGKDLRLFNETFRNAVEENLINPSLVRVAQVNNGHFFVVFDTSAIAVDYAIVNNLTIDEQKFELFIEDLAGMQERCFSVLEPNQLTNEINKKTQNAFGITLTEDLTDMVRRHNGMKPFSVELIKDLRNQLSEKETVKWVRDQVDEATYELKVEKPLYKEENIDKPTSPTLRM